MEFSLHEIVESAQPPAPCNIFRLDYDSLCLLEEEELPLVCIGPCLIR